MNEERKEVFVGIDVSKDTLEVYMTGWSKSRCHKNDTVGIGKIIEDLKGERVGLVVIEATGGYERTVIQTLQGQGLMVAQANPRQTHSFGQSLGTLAKSDPIDSKTLALYAEKIRPRAMIRLSDEMLELQALNRRRDQLNDFLVQEKNHAKNPTVSDSERQCIKESKKFIRRQIRKVDELRLKIVEKEATLKAIYQALDDEDGIAQQGACMLMGGIPELGDLNRAKVSALVGVAPYNDDSGKREGNRSIYGGRKAPRNILYMLTLTAIRRNEHIRKVYLNLVKRGKLKKVAIVACMRKYIIYLNSRIAEVKRELKLPALYVPTA